MRGDILFLACVGALTANADAKPLPSSYGYGRTANAAGQVLDLRGLLPKGPDAALQPASAAKPQTATLAAAPEPARSGAMAATCYGAAYNGQQTAAGEVYDPAVLSASHPDMPLASLALITNVRTGKEVIVRVNDRPASSTMNVSPAVASALGEGESCRLQVTVRRLGAAPYAAPGGRPYRQPATQAVLTSAPLSEPVITFIAPAQPPAATSVAAAVARDNVGFLVQIGSYSQRANAEAARTRAATAGPVSIETAELGSSAFHRVRLGPWSSREEAERARIAAEGMGFAGAKIITPQ